MIIQTAPEGQPHFVIMQAEHARMSGQLARAFGNMQFESLHPQALMERIVAHHDEGWLEVDARQVRDPHTSLPYHLTQTPTQDLVQTSAGSPTFNEKHHAFCGIISSMHTYGLFHGRYGLSDMIYIDRINPAVRPQVEAMLQGELARQARLKAQLAQDSATAEWADDKFLFHHYKLLQFFDTLSLYFHTTHPTMRGEAQFKNVPLTLGNDVTLTIKPTGDGAYAMLPFPFTGERVETNVEGRYTMKFGADQDAQSVLRAAKVERQSYIIVKE